MPLFPFGPNYLSAGELSLASFSKSCTSLGEPQNTHSQKMFVTIEYEIIGYTTSRKWLHETSGSLPADPTNKPLIALLGNRLSNLTWDLV